MNRVSVFSDRSDRSGQLRRELAGLLDVHRLGVEHIPHQLPEQFTVVDVNLKDVSRLPDLKEWLKRKPEGGKAIFVVDKLSRIEVTRAYGLGATDVVQRPLHAQDLLETVYGEFATLAGNRSTFAILDTPAVTAAADTLQGLFDAASLGQAIDPAKVQSAGDAIVGQIETQGLASWINTVRKYHSQTYQHCLLVTGVAAAFGERIGASRADRQRLAFAGMLHDVGKAKIPLAILEKPAALDAEELAVMRQHPQLGVDSLGTDSGLAPEMIDMVLHHHEYLDGSGYPHGLQGREIADLVRIMTISDVFGALIERRSYKPPLSSEAAYQILLDMGPKLDQDLVRAFRSTAQLGTANPGETHG
jgi:putative nucleotidyltransferase with HDIG domain